MKERMCRNGQFIEYERNEKDANMIDFRCDSCTRENYICTDTETHFFKSWNGLCGYQSKYM